MNSVNFKNGLCALALTLAVPAAAAADDVSAECRGVAAGVVAGMRAAGEVATQVATEAAVLAARRACAAVLEGFDSEGATAPASSSGEDGTDKKSEKMSVWEFITQDQERTKGNERLRRLRN